MIFYTVDKNSIYIEKDNLKKDSKINNLTCITPIKKSKEKFLEELKSRSLDQIKKNEHLIIFVNEINKTKFLKDYIANRDVIVNKEDGIYLNDILVGYYNLVIVPYKKSRGLPNKRTFQEYHNEIIVILNSSSIKSPQGINFLQYFFSFAEENNIKIHEIFNFLERCYITDKTINDEKALKSVNDILQYLQLLFCSYSCSLIKEHKNNRLNCKTQSKILSILNHEFPIFKYIDHSNKSYYNIFNTREFIFSCHKDTTNDNYEKSVILALLDCMLFGSHVINNDKILDKFFEINIKEFNTIIDIVSKFYYFFDIFNRNKISFGSFETKLNTVLNIAIMKLNFKFLKLYFNIDEKKHDQDFINEELKEFGFEDITRFLEDINELHKECCDKTPDMIKDNIKDLLKSKEKNIKIAYDDLYHCYNTFTKTNEKEKRIKESLTNNINEMRYI